MTDQEAQDLIEQIRREEGGRIKAEVTHASSGGKTYTALTLKLIPGQRSIRVAKVDEWPSIRIAWSMFS